MTELRYKPEDGEFAAISSIKVVSAILNVCFKQAMKNGLIERNPIPLTTLPKGNLKKQRRVFTKEEQDIAICIIYLHWQSGQG